ncbi:MAG: Ig-like domain-containing protein, partial [Erysipelotrichaceae bacterium]|nr:Ig-like domain-containing protein [Erysipelotrichaceae bacterium]
AFWLLNLSLNSSQSVLGQFGLSYQTDLINQYNGSLFGETIHLENFQRVKQCTGTFTQDEVEIKLNLDRIELKNYLMILDEGESQWIAVSAFPFGVEKRDILYTSSDTNVATVSSNGKVKAVESGNAIVTVSLKDGSYAAQCSVFVR